MSKKYVIEQLIKESYEKVRKLNSNALWIIAKVTWIFIAIGVLFYEEMLSD